LEAVVKEKEDIVVDQIKKIEELRCEIDKMAKREKEGELREEVINNYIENMKREVDQYKMQYEQAN
jgi:hypothetical protein